MGSRRRRFATSLQPPLEAQPPTVRSRRSRNGNAATSSSSSLSIRDPSKVQSLQSFSLYSQQRPPRHEPCIDCEGICTCEDITENTFYFVTPEGKTIDTVSLNMKSAHEGTLDIKEQCVIRQLPLHWAKEENVESIDYERGSIFVLDNFGGNTYKYLQRTLAKNRDFVIIGPQVLNYMFHRDVKEFFHSGYPIFTLGMVDVVVSLTGIRDPEQKEALISLVRKMGGKYDAKYTLSLTHMVSVSVISEKTVMAKQKKLPVMKLEWVEAVWKRSLVDLIHSTDAEFASYECPMFHNLSLCFSQISSRQKQMLQRSVEANGGLCTSDLIRKTSNLLVLVKGEGDKFRHAMGWGISSVRPDWITESCEKGYALPVLGYLVDGPDHPLSSTLLLGSEIRLPDMSTCSMIKNNTSFTPINSTDNSTRFLPDSMLMSANRDLPVVPHVVFLEGCRIFFSGAIDFNEAKIRLLNSGAIFVDRLDEYVTHVVVVDDVMPEVDMNALNVLTSQPYIVDIHWITESVSKKARADEELFNFNLTVLNPPPEDLELVEAENLPPGDTESSEASRKTGSSGRMDNFQEPSGLVNLSNPETPQAVESVFAEKKFYLAFQKNLIDYERAVNSVADLGGFVVTENWDFIIAPPVHVDKSILRYPHHTEYWLMDCDEQGSVEIPLYFHHKPLLALPGIEKLMEGVCIAISSYPAERHYLSAVARHMGAIVQDAFAKKKKNDILGTTHLICGTKDSDKYKAALRWRVPVVTCHWILACYSSRRILDTANFAIGVEAEDSISDVYLINTPVKTNQQPLRLEKSSSATVTSDPQSFSTAISNTINGCVASRSASASMSCEVAGPSCPGTINFAGVESCTASQVTPIRHPLVEAVTGRKLSIGSEPSTPKTQVQKFETPPYVCEYRLDDSYDLPMEEFRKQIYFPPLPSPETPKLHAEYFECMSKYCRGQRNNQPFEFGIRQLAKESTSVTSANEEVEVTSNSPPPLSATPL